MGVEDLPGMGGPQNKGGRPSKEDTGPREPDRDPYTQEHGKEYWLEKYNNNTQNNSLGDVIEELCRETYCLPRTVVRELHRHEIVDFMDTDDERWQSWAKSQSSFTNAQEDNDDNEEQNVSSGLGGLIN